MTVEQILGAPRERRAAAPGGTHPGGPAAAGPGTPADGGTDRGRRALSTLSTWSLRLALVAAGGAWLLLALPMPRWIDDMTPKLLVFAAVLAGAAAAAALGRWLHRPRLAPCVPAVGDEGVRHLLEGHGARDSLGYFALRPDKRAIFSASGKAAVCYGVVGGVSLASGDPLGDPEAWPQAIEAWLAEARRLGLRPAVLGAGRLAAVVYARHGLRVLELGDEAIVELAGFTLEGRAMRVVRQAAARVRRAGYTVTMRRLADVPASDLAELARYAETWRCDSGERGFSMALGRLDGALDPDYLIVEAFDGSGAPRAILGFAPWGVEGLSLDLMRRDRSSDNGLFEFMITELLSRCGGLTVARVSLNFAMFRSTFARAERLGGGPVLHGWCALLRFASRWWQLEQLYRANAKYQPLWVPRFVCYERARDLPAVAVAAAVAEGFLSLPTTGTERVEPVRAH